MSGDKPSEKAGRERSFLFFVIVLVALLLADRIVEIVLLQPIPQTNDLLEEVVQLGARIIGTAIILIFLASETKKAYNFLLKSEPRTKNA